MRAFFKLLKNDSATALSQQFSRRLMLGSSLCALQKRSQSSLPYCEPWSEGMMTRCFGFLRHTAMSKASKTRARASVGCMDHSMIMRLCKYQIKQTGIFDRTWRERFVDPLVEPTPRDSQGPTPCLYRILVGLRMNEGVLYSDSLAKYANACFRISCSSWVRRSLARSFKIYFFVSSNSSLRFSDLFCLSAFPHLYRLCGETPSRAATS